jgi:hypothetical protein
MVRLDPGLPAILTIDGKIDEDRHRRLSDGESVIRLPAPSRPGHSTGDFNWPAHGSRVVVHADAPLAELPINSKLLFTVVARGDVQLPPDDGRTVGFYGHPLNSPIEFLAASGVTITAPAGKTTLTASPWQVVVLTKVGPTAWEASGDLITLPVRAETDDRDSARRQHTSA